MQYRIQFQYFHNLVCNNGSDILLDRFCNIDFNIDILSICLAISLLNSIYSVSVSNVTSQFNMFKYILQYWLNSQFGLSNNWPNFNNWNQMSKNGFNYNLKCFVWQYWIKYFSEPILQYWFHLNIFTSIHQYGLQAWWKFGETAKILPYPAWKRFSALYFISIDCDSNNCFDFNIAK